MVQGAHKRLTLAPITIKAARRWIAEKHSYLGAPRGGLLAVSVLADGRRCCVAVAEVPKARRLMDGGLTAEISRVASDGTEPHAASKAGMALVRALSSVGYDRFVSATLLGEPGTMFRAMGWWPTAIIPGGEWDKPGRHRAPAEQPGKKIRWEFGPRAAPRSEEAEAALREALGHPRPLRRERLGPLFDGVAASPSNLSTTPPERNDHDVLRVRQ